MKNTLPKRNGNEPIVIDTKADKKISVLHASKLLRNDGTANHPKKNQAHRFFTEQDANKLGVNNIANTNEPTFNQTNKKYSSVARSNLRIIPPVAETEDERSFGQAKAAGLMPFEREINLHKSFLRLRSHEEKEFAFTVTNIGLKNISIPCPEAEKNAAGNKRYLEFYGGPDYAFRSFSDTANSSYLQKRKESTKVLSAFSFGIRYTKVFENAVSFRTGINYSQVNERFRYEQGHVVQHIFIIDGNGDTTGTYTSTGTRFKTTHNRYKTIDVPLLIGYEMGNTRFHSNINGGLVVNVYSWQKGDVLNSANEPVSITTGKNNSPYQFKTNVGIGLMGAASFYYKLNGRMHLLAEPYIRYNFSAANKADITLKQKYTTAGIRLGARFDF